MNEALIRARREKMLVQTDVARALQVYSTTVSKWERGIVKPNKERREQLCTLLGKAAEELGL